MIPPAIHILSGEYPPNAGGVGDYAALLARALASSGVQAHVWCPDVVARTEDGVVIHRLPDGFGSQSCAALETWLDAAPGALLLQYAPNALGARGANLPFCRWLKRRGRLSDVRIMFHEPYMYFGWHPARTGLALVQRLMAHQLLRASGRAYVSTGTWRRYLEAYAPRGTAFVTLPIPATVPGFADQAAVHAWRERLAGGDTDVPLAVHFGTFGDHIASELRGAIPAILAAHATARVVCVGRGSEAFAREMQTDGRVIATGALPAADVSAVLRACDLAVQPYPDGITTRRTTVMAALANEVPTLSTHGTLTESFWRESGAVALAPAGDAVTIGGMAATLLHDAEARSALASAGHRAYDRWFALERTVERLIGAVRSESVPR